MSDDLGEDDAVLGALLDDPDDRCPTCGSRPDDDTVHRDGCPRLDTCGQYGPPWLDEPWHPEDPPLPDRKGLTQDEWDEAAKVWREALAAHRLVHFGRTRDA